MDRLTSEASAPAKPFGLEWGAGVAALLLAGCGSGAGTDPASARRDDTGAAVAADPIPADATGTPDAHETPSSSEKPVPPKRVDATSAATPSPPNDGDYGDDFWNLGAGSRTQLGFSLDPRMASGTALFLCDALARPVVLALTVPDALGEARLVTIPKTNRPQSARIVTVEMPDPGAGNIHYPLTVEGRTIGDVHAVNWGILPGNTVPTVRSVTVDGTTHECRWAPNTRVLAVTPRRTVLITGRPKQGQLRYRTFNDGASLPVLTGDTAEQGTKASLDLTGGRQIGDAFVFANKGYSYRLTTGGRAQLTVSRDGKVIQTEPLLAWTVGGSSPARP